MTRALLLCLVLADVTWRCGPTPACEDDRCADTDEADDAEDSETGDGELDMLDDEHPPVDMGFVGPSGPKGSDEEPLAPEPLHVTQGPRQDLRAFELGSAGTRRVLVSRPTPRVEHPGARSTAPMVVPAS